MSQQDGLEALARQLADMRVRFVLAESCTGGLISATLTEIAGISEWHCGSMVTYRPETKIGWLQLDRDQVEQNAAVTRAVAEQMALNVLRMTPEAQWSASVTGNLGPTPAGGMDGVVFIGVAHRRHGSIEVQCQRHRLEGSTRRQRQRAAAEKVLSLLLESIAACSDHRQRYKPNDPW